MSEILKKIFKNITDEDIDRGGEVAVLCPFPHDNLGGQLEERPSAHYNIDKKVFHCKSCGSGLSYAGLVSKLLGNVPTNVDRLQKVMDNPNSFNWELAHSNLLANTQKIEEIKTKWGISENVMNDLKIGISNNLEFSVPVFLFGSNVDNRKYSPNSQMKWIGDTGSMTGMIVPYDKWIESEEPTLICEGEKDMLIARSKGFNAIAITGGAHSIPKMFSNAFKNKRVYIAFDNDEAGKNGAIKLATWLKQYTEDVFNVTEHHEIVGQKEDLWDFFMKYNKTKQDLNAILSGTNPFKISEIESPDFDRISFKECLDATHRDKWLNSNIQIIAVSPTSFNVSNYSVEYGFKKDDNRGQATYELGNDNLETMLKLEIPEKNITSTINNLAWPWKDSNDELLRFTPDIDPKSFSWPKTIGHNTVTTFTASNITTYKAFAEGASGSMFEIDGYIVNKEIQPGHTYNITYKVVPHPLKSGRLVILVKDLEPIDDFINDFEVTDEVKQSLNKFKPGISFEDGKLITESASDKVDKLYRQGKGYEASANYFRKDLFLSVDLVMNSPLDIKYQEGENIKGALDVFLIGDTRVGKSHCTEAVMNNYGQGVFNSLKTSTTISLIGGSKDTVTGKKTVIGEIPKQHKKMVALEEVQGAEESFIKSLTDIRSRNKLLLSRINGSLVMDCKVRLISIANPLSRSSIGEYPGGIDIIKDLVKASEDIARYDYFLIIPKSTELTDPDNKQGVLKPFEKEDYENRLKWVWSRQAEHVKITKEVRQYIWKVANELNKEYPLPVNLFGSEANKKLTRIAAAFAGMLCSTKDYINLDITTEHIDLAKEFLLSLYNTSTFKLKEYSNRLIEETEVSAASTKVLESLNIGNSVLLEYLFTSSLATRQDLLAVSGLDNKDFNGVINELVRHRLLKIDKNTITVTIKFKKTYENISKKDKPLRVAKAGEVI